MPLVRFEVRNEYGLGNPELYRSAETDEPKALLEGVAVAGLVGILRQLGDLAEFAAEIFHELHDQVMATAARSQDMMLRVQHMEAGLPSLEKAALAQTSHVHFAYTLGSDWHASVRTEQNHLTRGDLPGFIMDSYEECRGPPHLFLLDKFDVAGPGACLKRYSDPSFFKMEWATSELLKAEKSKQERKVLKKKSRRQRSIKALNGGSLSRNYNSGDDISTHGMKSKSNKDSAFQSLSSGTKISYMEPLFYKSEPCGHVKVETDVLATSVSNMQCINVETSVISYERAEPNVENESLCESSHKGSIPESPPFIWDSKTEVISLPINSGFNAMKGVNQAMAAITEGFSKLHVEENKSIPSNVIQHTVLVDENKPESCAGDSQDNDIVSEPDNYVDALNTMESEVETDSESRMKEEMEFQCAGKETELESGTKEKELPPCTSKCSDVEIPSVPSENFSQVDLEGHNRSLSINIFKSEVYMAPADEMTKETISMSDEGNYVADNHKSTSKFATSTHLQTNGGLLELEPSKPLDLSSKINDPGAGCETHGYISNAVIQTKLDIDQLFSTDGDMEQKQKPKPGVPNLLPEYVMHIDVLPGMNSNEVVEETTCFVESHTNAFQKQQAKQYDGFFEHSSGDSTTAESSLMFEDHNNVNGVKVQEVDILFSGCELAASSNLEVQSAISVSRDGCSINGFQREPLADQELSGCEACGYTSDTVTQTTLDSVQLSHVDGAMEQKQKPKSRRVLNVLPEYVMHTDDPDINPNEVGQGTRCLVDSDTNEFQKQYAEQYDVFEQNSGGSTICKLSMKYENYDNVNGLKVQEANILFSGCEPPESSGIEVQSSIFLSGDGCPIKGFQREPLASQQVSDMLRNINKCENLSDEAGQQKTGETAQPASANTDSKSICLEQPRSELESPQNFVSSRSHCSDCSSPPLEHIKISFHPLNNLDASTLDNLDGSVRGDFSPSFHQLPEPSVPLREIGERGPANDLSFLSLSLQGSQSMPMFEESATSKQLDSEIDSDDDTFCKPSLHLSEDMLSQGSESKSEQWECIKGNGHKDDLYDGLHRISSCNSISSSLGMEEASNCPKDCLYESKDAGMPDYSRPRKGSTAGSVDLSASGIHISQINLQERESGPNKKIGFYPT